MIRVAVFIVALSLLCALITFTLFTGFMVAAGYKRTLGAGIKLSVPRYVITAAWFVVGLVADALYNLIIGTVVFRQAPKFPELYTWRIQRNVARTDWRGDLARNEAAFLNANLPGHIKL